MRAKVEEKKKALILRKQGLSYSEILRQVKVSKSSLSLWLRLIHIKKSSKSLLKKKLIEAGKLGAIAKRQQRIRLTENITKGAISEIKQVGDRDLFYMGVMLYWAEGAKARGRHISQGVDFSNSDPAMCRLFLIWLQHGLRINSDRIYFSIYIHESQKRRSGKALSYWLDITKFPFESFSKICFTKTVYPRKNKRKGSKNYYGQLRIRIRRSTNLNRKIAGWVDGICLKCGAKD